MSWAGIEFAADWQAMQPPEPITLQMNAYMPENGGWVADALKVEAGQPVELVVRGREGTHAFAIAHTDIRSTQIEPGQTETVTFTAPEPGRYVLYCTLWCSPNHWRMRTVLQVVDPADPKAPVSYVQDPQRYVLPLADLDLDAPHPAQVWPAEKPEAEAGMQIWNQLGLSAVTPEAWLAEQGWPLVTPEQAFLAIRSGQLTAEAAQLTEMEQWSLVAYLWRSQTTPETLRRGATLYQENCEACHGPTGGGDGFAAAFSPGQEPDLRQASRAAGASPGLYYAKIARGGMGTGMPNWGVIFGEEDLWAVVDSLYAFLFEYGHD